MVLLWLVCEIVARLRVYESYLSWTQKYTIANRKTNLEIIKIFCNTVELFILHRLHMTAHVSPHSKFQ